MGGLAHQSIRINNEELRNTMVTETKKTHRGCTS